MKVYELIRHTNSPADSEITRIGVFLNEDDAKGLMWEYEAIRDLCDEVAKEYRDWDVPYADEWYETQYDFDTDLWFTFIEEIWWEAWEALNELIHTTVMREATPSLLNRDKYFVETLRSHILYPGNSSIFYKVKEVEVEV